MRNSLSPDETVVYVDAVHPAHQAKPAGRWLPRGQRCALPAASGRDRLNLHGAIDLETGQTRIMEFRDFAEAVLGFLRKTVPEWFDGSSLSISDNFRVIDPKDFRILA